MTWDEFAISYVLVVEDRNDLLASVTVHRMNHFSKEGLETGIFIDAQIAWEKHRLVREYSLMASHRQ